MLCESIIEFYGNYTSFLMLYQAVEAVEGGMKKAPGDAHPYEDAIYRKRPRPARECALAHSYY